MTVEGDRAVNLAGDPSHPFTRGGLCAKVNHYLERVYSADRLLHPLRRTGPKGAGEFEPVGNNANFRTGHKWSNDRILLTWHE
jgi:anaerobic selenocysteine-containing dehydrogenase